MRKSISLIMGLAAYSAAAVTLNVTVPAGTPQVYVAGAFNNWSLSSAPALTPSGDNRFSADLPEISDSDLAGGFKYLCGRDWKYVEKSASGGEIGNRTKATDNDVVGSWAALYNPFVKEFETTVNGYSRKVKILLPSDYETSSENYPVVYYLGVQQRYSAAGGDNSGDDFFGSDSWDASAVARAAEASGEDGVILVSTYTFVAESMPFEHEDFAGSGAADDFLKDWMDGVVGYVNSNYRTDRSAAATTVIGADLGGLLSAYTALKYPEVFGKCVSISPMLWLNIGDMCDLASSSDGEQLFVFTYGTGESEPIAGDVALLAEALGSRAVVRGYAGGVHNDVSWKAVLADVYPFFTTGKLAPAAAVAASVPASRIEENAVSGDCTFYYTQSGTTPAADSSVSFVHTEGYMSKAGEQIPALVLVKPISKSFTGTCYWNVYDNESGAMLMSSNGKVAFSSKKTATSWLRVAVREDGTVESCAASSIGFRLKGADATTLMNVVSDYKVSADITFLGDDKSFVVNYGSVNSQSDMGAVTGTYEVSSDCVGATVVYDFMLNTVSVTETAWGAPLGKVYVERFSAVPSVTKEGQSSHITVSLSEGYTPSIAMTVNYGTESALTLTPGEDGQWHTDMNALKAGIYHLTLKSTSPAGVVEEAGQIAVKVTSGNVSMADPIVTVNAYDGIDWTTTGRYKSNFHTHTSQSFDTKFATHEVVDRYHNAGYKILALTDHDYNPYPWTLFNLYNTEAESRDPEAMGMLTVPGVELSKDNRNQWEEVGGGGGYFNHHNDFFTGRKGQEFATLRESYAYTEKIGGMQIINHPGQYWSLSTSYAATDKNSPQWHAENFKAYSSLVGLEVYNQGNRRPNDRILWDQILDITMPSRPVWGYSGDDTHTLEQYFRNYNIMLMPELTVDALKEAMKGGHEYFSYEYTGSGEAKAPAIASIEVDNEAHTITVDTDADAIYWIYSTDKPSSGSASSRKSTVVGMGKTFHFSGYQGRYVRALLTNAYGETCTQPFGIENNPGTTGATLTGIGENRGMKIFPNPASDAVTVQTRSAATAISIFNAAGAHVLEAVASGNSNVIDISPLRAGTYIVKATGPQGEECGKLIVR